MEILGELSGAVGMKRERTYLDSVTSVDLTVTLRKHRSEKVSESSHQFPSEKFQNVPCRPPRRLGTIGVYPISLCPLSETNASETHLNNSLRDLKN